MKNKLKNVLTSLLLTNLIFGFSFFSLRAADTYNQASAKSYLMAHSNNPWVTMSLAATGSTRIPSDYLKSVSGSSAIEYEAPILAITALGEDPRNFGGADLVGKLKSYFSDGQLGDPGTLNDDIFGVLALIASGELPTDNVVTASKNFIATHQNQDGGWGYSITGPSDVGTTAAAILALLSSGTLSSSNQIKIAQDYIKSAQNDDGGFGYSPGSASDTSSTAWVIWSLNALGISQASWTRSGHAPTDYLVSNQAAEGYFKYQNDSSEDSFSPITTAYAAIALSGKTLPLNIIAPEAKTYAFRIEGSRQTVCEGSVAGPTVLDIVKNASSQCGFTYHIQNSSFGQYLDKINSDQAAGMQGWMYFVNNISPDKGAADYVLGDGDQVLWYFGDFGWKPSRLSLSASEIEAGQNVTATVETFTGSDWIATNGATVYYGASSAKTDDDGQATLTPVDGYYQVYAEGPGLVRSNTILLKAGQPQSSAVSLAANINLGMVKGDATTTEDSIAFTVSPSALDFGDLLANETAQKILTISNTGTTGINIHAHVAGDPLFTDNLKLGDSSWRTFSLDLPANANQNINASLTVPLALSTGSGQKSGTIIFWAN